MCLQNPMFLGSHQKLLDTAWNKVDQTYAFKKRSHSKKYSTDLGSEQATPKCPRLLTEAQAEQIKALQKEVRKELHINKGVNRWLRTLRLKRIVMI